MCRVRMVRLLAHGGLRRRGERVSLQSTKKSHKKECCGFHVQTNLSNFSIFVNRHPAKCPQEETLSNMKKMKKQKITEL